MKKFMIVITIFLISAPSFSIRFSDIIKGWGRGGKEGESAIRCAPDMMAHPDIVDFGPSPMDVNLTNPYITASVKPVGYLCHVNDGTQVSKISSLDYSYEIVGKGSCAIPSSGGGLPLECKCSVSFVDSEGNNRNLSCTGASTTSNKISCIVCKKIYN